MKLRLLAVSSLAALALASFPPLPAASGEPADPSGLELLGDAIPPIERYVPRSPGTEKTVTLRYGPFTIPPGQDLNRIVADVPLLPGVVTAIRPDLLDVATGATPPNRELHIHHAHWFRYTRDPGVESYYAQGLSWVFGTGEERTQGSLDERAAANPGGPRYGLFLAPDEAHLLIYMVHNKLPRAANVYVTLTVRFVAGSPGDIRAATSCPDLVPGDGEACAAGQEFRVLTSKLWGATFNVPRQAGNPGDYVYPPGRRLGLMYEATHDGTMIVGAGHIHQNGREIVVANLGPAGSACEADLDRDGFPGITIFRSRKFDRVPEAWPYSEEFQMGVTKHGWRAPVRTGDRITLFAKYVNADFASYQAMAYIGFYEDRREVPPARGAAGCTLENTRARLLDDPTGDPRLSIPNRPWEGEADTLCGPGLGPACDRPVLPRGPGMETSLVHVAGFTYLPGDPSLAGALGAPPRVKQGASLRFVNEDSALGVRHTVTSCRWPCNGPYVANYPQPDGRFDSGRRSNLDPLDGGITGDETEPHWDSPKSLGPGLYSFYCRIHPTMRGAFEVVQ